MPTLIRPAPSALMPLLKSLSRSFYLSIRLLPGGMREPVALGYLLARASDTIADTASIGIAQRSDALDELARRVAACAPPSAAALVASAHPSDFPAGPERELIEALPQCLRWLDQLHAHDLADVREVLRHITRGQQLDLQRCTLRTAAELDEYTYLVAGCVGEFWTHVARRHVPGFTKQPIEQMLTWGRSYGQGLQLVNILRDAAEDAATGRCYLPWEQPDPIPWLKQAHAGMDDGMSYALAVDERRLRVASALPALIGVRTLNLLAEANPASNKVKVPRREVRRLLWRVALGLGGRASLQTLYAQWDNPRP